MNHAFSDENSAVVKNPTIVKIVKDEVKDEKVLDQSPLTSAENRKNLKYQLATSFFGREYIGNAVTISVGYFLKPNDLITLRYSTYNGSNDKALQKLRAVTAGYRHFLGNSFNFMPAVYYRRNTADYFKEGAATVTGSNNLVYEDIGLGIRVGNEWQWKNFTMGCDWIGVNSTIIKLNHDEHALGAVDDLSLQKGITVTFLSFYIGYSF